MTAPLSAVNSPYTVSLQREPCHITNDIEFIDADIYDTQAVREPVRVAQITGTVFLTDRFTDDIMGYLQNLATGDPTASNPHHLALLAIGGICLEYTKKKPEFHPRAFIDLSVEILSPGYHDLPVQEAVFRIKSAIQERNPVVVYSREENPVWKGHDLSSLGFAPVTPALTPDLLMAHWVAPTASTTPSRLSIVK